MRYIILLSALLNLHGAEYYIDYVGGDDSNAGTSEGAAWKHHPWDPNATGTSAATTPSTTSTNYFKGGVSYGGQIRLKSDGDSTTPMLFTSKSGWGTGMGKFDPTNTLTYAFAGRTAADADRYAKNYTFDTLEFYRIGGYADDNPILTNTCASPITSPNGGTGIYFNAGVDNVTVRNCYFHEIGQWRNQPPFSGTVSIIGTGVNLGRAKNCNVSSNYFTKTRVGIAIKGRSSTNNGLVSDITTSSNVFDGYTVWQMDIAPQSSGVTFSNILVSASTFNNNADYDSGNWLGCGEKPHSDGIFLRTSGLSSSWTNVFVRNCKFVCDRPGDSAGGTAGVYISQGPSVTVEGCIFIGNPLANAQIEHGGEPIIPVGETQHVIIRNNTFFSAYRAIDIGLTTYTNRTISAEIYNNLIIRLTSGIYDAFQSSGTNAHTLLQCYNNAYSKIVQDSTASVIYYSGSYKTLASFQTLGFEANSFYTVDPLIACGTTIPEVRSTGNYQPVSGSPLIGAGFYSADIPPDINGTTRANPPAIGAYEYAGAAPNAPEITTHPVSKTVVNGASADLLVVATGDAPLTYQWYAGFSGDTSAPIANATNSIYTATYTASAVRWVQVTNGSGSADSATATVTVVAVETGTTSASRRRRR